MDEVTHPALHRNAFSKRVARRCSVIVGNLPALPISLYKPKLVTGFEPANGRISDEVTHDLCIGASLFSFKIAEGETG
jgi:hypothetical protein